MWRLFVWGILLASVLYAGYSCQKVLFKKDVAPPAAEPVENQRSLPDPTKQYEYEEARLLLIEAQKLLRSGEYGGAQLLENILNNHPQSPQARRAMLILAGTYRYNLKQMSKARRMYEKFLLTYPTDREVPRVIMDLRTLNRETNTPDNTRAIIRRILPQVEDKPAVKKKLEALLISR